MKADIHPDVRRRHGALLVRQHVHDPLDQARPARRALQRVPPLLHRQAEAGRHRWPHRALRAPLRQAQGQGLTSVRPTEPAPGRATRADVATAASRLDAAAGARREPLRASSAGARRAAVPGRRRACASRSTAWVLLDDDPAPALGPRAGLGRPARRSTSCTCWSTSRRRGVARPPGRDLPRPADRCGVADGRDARRRPAPDAGPRRRSPPPDAAELVGAAPRAPALDVVVEHGVVTGEVSGLEVRARSSIATTAARLEVGVGRTTARRSPWCTATCRTADALARCVDIVARHRRPARAAPSAQPAGAASAGCARALLAEPGAGRRRRARGRRAARPAAATVEGRRGRRRRVGVDATVDRVRRGRARSASTSTSCPSAADARLALAPDARLRARAARARRATRSDAPRLWPRRPSRRAPATGAPVDGDWPAP